MVSSSMLILSRFTHVQPFVTLWTAARHAPLFIRLPRQEYWSGSPFPPPGDLPNPGIEPSSLVSPANPPLLCLLHWQAGSLPLIQVWTHRIPGSEIDDVLKHDHSKVI